MRLLWGGGVRLPASQACLVDAQYSYRACRSHVTLLPLPRDSILNHRSHLCHVYIDTKEQCLGVPAGCSGWKFQSNRVVACAAGEGLPVCGRSCFWRTGSGPTPSPCGLYYQLGRCCCCGSLIGTGRVCDGRERGGCGWRAREGCL